MGLGLGGRVRVRVRLRLRLGQGSWGWVRVDGVGDVAYHVAHGDVPPLEEARVAHAHRGGGVDKVAVVEVVVVVPTVAEVGVVVCQVVEEVVGVEVVCGGGGEEVEEEEEVVVVVVVVELTPARPCLETTPPQVTSYLSGSATSPGVLPTPMVPLNQPSSSPPSRLLRLR